jgi:hypothetical protein
VPTSLTQLSADRELTALRNPLRCKDEVVSFTRTDSTGT